MAEDKMVRAAETTEIRRVVTTADAATEQRSWLDSNLSPDTTPSGWREPVIVTPIDPVATPDVATPVVAQGGGDE